MARKLRVCERRTLKHLVIKLLVDAVCVRSLATCKINIIIKRALKRLRPVFSLSKIKIRVLLTTRQSK